MTDILQQEKNDVLKFILNERFFQYWHNGRLNPKYADLEIFITPDCNQTCEYCYLCKRKEELYPRETLQRDNLIKNLRMLFDYILKKNYHIPELEFFSGEIWHTDFGAEVLEITLEYMKKGMDIHGVIIPTNAYFVKDINTLTRIQKLIDEYKAINHFLIFSLSVDGAVIENKSRPLNSGEQKEDDFYERLFSFAKHNGFHFHPMVSASNVKYWIENYDWFVKKLREYNLSPYQSLMMLEVRDDNWTEEALEDYKKYLKHYIYSSFEDLFDKDVSSFAAFVADEETFASFSSSYIPFRIFELHHRAANCSISAMLTIRLGDLMITPCHRLSVPAFHYGQFVVENDEIVDIEAKNTYMANKVFLTNNDLATVKCDTCVLNKICVKGCYGSQYESSGDPFIPIQSVCDLFMTKVKTTFEAFEDIGVFKELEKYDIQYYSYPTIELLKEIKEELLKNHAVEKKEEAEV